MQDSRWRHCTSPAFVTRAGEKLAFALDRLAIDVRGLVCADLGSHVGGFVDCLLQRGAARIYSIDTAYGILAWKLRKDPRVLVMERTNAMHVSLPEHVDFVTIDVGWTRQEHILPNAATLLRPAARALALIKPHYEACPSMLVDGVLSDACFEQVITEVRSKIERSGWRVVAQVESPIQGHGGNRELLALLLPSAAF